MQQGSLQAMDFDELITLASEQRDLLESTEAEILYRIRNTKSNTYSAISGQGINDV